VSEAAEPRRTADRDLAALLVFLNESRGFDFSGYKRSSLERRIQKRMAAVGVDDYAAYRDYLELTPEEFTELFDTILINVTGFLRDRPAWDYLAASILPPMLAELDDQEPIRVWSAACATGEEAYSVAMVLAEALGDASFRERVKIYATDIDERALAHARQGVYSTDALKVLPTELRERYFEANHLGQAFRSDLRRSVIFGRNDLVKDAPISRIDLLICRNTLMYFNAEAQERILTRLNFALKPKGILFLGKSEMLVTHADLFLAQNVRFRFFRRADSRYAATRLTFTETMRGSERETPPERYLELRNTASEVIPMAQVLVDRQGFVATVNRAARSLFNLGSSDVGRLLQDLELSYRPIELRAGLQQAYDQLKVIDLGRARYVASDDDEARVLDVKITPLHGLANQPLGASITFDDVTTHTHLVDEFEHTRRQLESAYEELQSTVEELETTNEELQSTNEELETTNEELQSTNEELETMNEELQSTNEELETMNDEHEIRAAELDRANLFLEGILESLQAAVIVVDPDRRVQLWNRASADLWGLRGDEVQGRPLSELDIGLPYDPLSGPLTAALSESEETEILVEALTRRGRSILFLVRVLPLAGRLKAQGGAILIVSEASADGGRRN
jgi:two-component system CheB/CheR fusion protein